MTKYLLDTHALLWYWGGNKQLSQKSKELIENSENQIFLSVVSLWEIALKVSIGKLTLPLSYDDIQNKLIEDKIELVAIQFEDTKKLVQLPFHHKDPFDRMLIAQELNLEIPIIGKDETFDLYPIQLIW